MVNPFLSGIVITTLIVIVIIWCIVDEIKEELKELQNSLVKEDGDNRPMEETTNV